MHEMFENWSLPWQTLQRSLAEAFGAQAEASSRVALKSVNLPASNWLVRARSSTLQAHRTGQQP